MGRKYFRFIVAAVMVILTISTAAACGKKDVQDKSITIAEQYGLAYGPLQIMKEKKLLEKNMPGIQVKWVQLSNTAAIREAMLAGDVDAGFMALPPFLIGLDKGMEWKIATGLSSSRTGLVTNRPNVTSIRDFTSSDRIALPQPGSVQHILLSMECERVFKDARKLDNLIASMSHPDGMNALLAKGDISAHFTSSPYLEKELAVSGMKEILSSYDAFGGDFTFIAGVATKDLHDSNPAVYEAFVKSVEEAIEYTNNNREEAASELASAYNLTPEEVLKYLKTERNSYSAEVEGTMEFMAFMKRNGYISKEYDAKELYWNAGESKN
ncbi:MAG: ABC transporter substrate-binding protein [Clostridiaceae bacterium]